MNLTQHSKLSILARIALPLASAALTCYQMPFIISEHFLQPTRSLLASLDILLTTFISNAVVLLSLLRDRGYKKTKYKHGTALAGFHTKGTMGIGGRKRVNESPPLTKWGSDENLVSSNDRGYGDTKDVSIRMEVLSDKRSRSSAERTSPERTRPEHGLDLPPQVKLQEIRIASTWEVSVENRPREQ